MWLQNQGEEVREAEFYKVVCDHIPGLTTTKHARKFFYFTHKHNVVCHITDSQ